MARPRSSYRRTVILLIVFLALAVLMFRSSVSKKTPIVPSPTASAARPRHAQDVAQADETDPDDPAQKKKSAESTAFAQRISGTREIAGIVLDATSGALTGGAKVELHAGDEVIDETVSQADGRFRFSALAEGVYFIFAESGAKSGEGYVHLAARNEESVRVEVSPNADLFVRVRSQDGRPVANAALEIHVSNAIATMVEGRTDARGEYHASIKPGSGQVYARLDGYVEASDAFTVEGGLDTKVQLELKKGVAFKMRVVDPKGAPVSEADVSISAENNPETTSYTNPEGVADFPAVALGTHEVFVSAAGWAPSRHVLQIDESKKDKLIEVELSRGYAIRGRMIDQKQRPVSGMSVEASRAYEEDRAELAVEPYDAMVPARAVTGDDGRFVIAGAQPGSWTLRIIDGVAQLLVEREIDVGAGDVEVELVVTPRGEPIRGTVRGLTAESGVNCTVFAFSPEVEEELSFARASRSSIAADGTFEFLHLAEGEYRLATFCPYDQLQSQRPRDLAKTLFAKGVSVKTGDDKVVLDVSGNASIEGKVSFGGGAIPADLTLTAQVRGQKLSFKGERFVLERLSPGPARVEVSAPGHASAAVELELKDGERTTVDLELERYFTAHGRVIDDVTGQPIAGASIVAVRMSRPEELYTESEGPRSANTSSSGEFDLADMKAGAYQLITSHPTHATDHRLDVSIEASATSPIEIRLKGSGDLFGQVTKRGAPVAGVNLSMTAESGNALHDPADARTDADGRFRVRRLAPGRYKLYADVTVGADGSGYRRYATAVEISEAGVQSLVVDLSAHRGRISIVSRRKLPPGRLLVTRDGDTPEEVGMVEDLAGLPFGQGRSGAEPVEIDGLETGRYVVLYNSDDGGACATQTVTLGEGSLERVEFAEARPCQPEIAEGTVTSTESAMIYY